MKIVNTDAWLLDFIQDMIKKNGAKEGIDPNMFCFDIGIKEKLESIYAQRVKKDKPSDTTLSIEEIKRLIDYYDERGDYKKSAEFKVKLARMTTLIIDYDSISKNILDEMNIAEASLDYQKVSELRCQLAIIKYAQQNDNLSYEEKIALYADRIKSAEDNGDYVSRAVWMQLLDIVDEAKKRHF